MSFIPTVVASYTVAATHAAGETDTSNSVESLKFEAPIVSAGAGSNGNALYLGALAQALSALQESVNAGLTKRLIEQGVLAEASENGDLAVNTKLRTKVPGQPNNSKKGQTKKQQQRAQQQNSGENQMAITTAAPTQDTTPTIESVSAVASSMDVDPINTTTLETSMLSNPDMEHQYKPKGGIYGGDDDENNQDKDEVDLVMEADPGEVDGACLELPKGTEDQQQQQQQYNKKRNVLPAETASAKKSRGSEDV
ncbi:hypothetical protein BGZ70_006700 [Mortierella alpina]|uniref:Uncharacterized protein n=1 Tax=Mortierella alpina TaxID=64518 RepID=A0A9P6J9Q1_MORAP|nr:hypothetical protein BGZ70_006700 [Mortierella alpina]